MGTHHGVRAETRRIYVYEGPERAREFARAAGVIKAEIDDWFFDWHKRGRNSMRRLYERTRKNDVVRD